MTANQLLLLLQIKCLSDQYCTTANSSNGVNVICCVIPTSVPEDSPVLTNLGFFTNKSFFFWQVVSQPDMEKELQGVVVSSVAVKVKPAHPVIGVAISSS
jgi:hypothetical protein